RQLRRNRRVAPDPLLAALSRSGRYGEANERSGDGGGGGGATAGASARPGKREWGVDAARAFFDVARARAQRTASDEAEIDAFGEGRTFAAEGFGPKVTPAAEDVGRAQEGAKAFEK